MPSPTLGQLFGIGIPPDTVVGLRIKAKISKWYLDRHGNARQATIDITVGAYAYDRLEDVKQAAVDWVNSGGLNRVGRSQSTYVVDTASVQQLILGGIESPALQL